MAETTERVLRLLGLLQQRPVWTGPELAERLGVTTRSIRRDVERLRSLGYPVYAAQGVGGGYQLGRGRALPPLLLDDTEAVAVAVSLRMAAGGTVSGASEAALRTLAKLDQVMPPRLRGEVRAIHEATQTLRVRPGHGRRRRPADPGPCSVRDTVRVRFGYESRDGTSTSRTVEPVGLVAAGRRWYLMAYDVDRDDWRTFRLDRMTSVATTTWRFRERDHEDPGGVRPAVRGQRGVPLPGADRRACAAAEVQERRQRPVGGPDRGRRRDHDPGGGVGDAIRAGVPPVLPRLGVRGAEEPAELRTALAEMGAPGPAARGTLTRPRTLGTWVARRPRPRRPGRRGIVVVRRRSKEPSAERAVRSSSPSRSWRSRTSPPSAPTSRSWTRSWPAGSSTRAPAPTTSGPWTPTSPPSCPRTGSTEPGQVRHVTEILEDGRYAIACVRARVAGEPLPTRRPPCFFDPRHGLSVADVEWTPPGGTPRQVPACALDAERVRSGAEPDTRQVMVGAQRLPYYQGGPAYAPYAAGYFGGGMNMLFTGLLVGSLLDGGLG